MKCLSKVWRSNIMLIYPEIDPVALKLGPLSVRWYGLMYIIGFSLAWGLGWWRARRADTPIKTQQVEELIFQGALGIILGGRMGYVLFYNFNAFLHDPLLLFRIWEGGMSFHGGLLGAFVVIALFSWRHGIAFFALSDFIAPLISLGLGAGRIGNFINGELWGRPSDLPWAMVFPQAGPMARHPSQLYEALLEGLVFFTILWIYTRKPRPIMAPTGMALLIYGAIRFSVEFAREPDAHLGFILFDWMTMGQLLSLPMAITGAILLGLALHHQRIPPMSMKRN